MLDAGHMAGRLDGHMNLSERTAAASGVSGPSVLRIWGGCDMSTVNEASAQVDCVGPDEMGNRRDFLSVISKLPHVDLSRRRDLGLAHTIEAEIIPRLMLAHRDDLARSRPLQNAHQDISSEDIARFSAIVCAADVVRARGFVRTLQARRVSTETIMLALLAPAAKLLGEMWEEDDVDFAEVTIALCCLQQVLREISGTLPGGAVAGRDSPRALLATVPGEKHIFSVLMVDEFFRRAQWDVWTMPAATEQEILDLVRREEFDMAGISASSEACLPQLGKLIGRMRDVSRNRQLAVMVGGHLFTADPGLAYSLGADATASDGRQAVQTAETIIKKFKPSATDSASIAT